MNILVTGGASGLGEAITRALAASPEHKIHFTYCRSEENARALEKSFANVKGIRCDFADTEDLRALVDAMDTMELDALVNNAITGLRLERFHEVSPDVFRDGFARNVLPVVTITQKAITLFRARGRGRIVTILTSYLSSRPPLGLSAYIAEKAYIASLSRSWAIENERFKVAVNTVSPSFMETGLTKDVDPRLIESSRRSAISPQRVASEVASLLAAPIETTGTNILLGPDAITVA